MFFGSKQRQRSQCFDLLREDTERALRVNQTGEWVGNLPGLLLSINRDAYLPNIRSGRAYAPREYRGKRHATAILPVTMYEATRLTKVIQPITDEYLPPRHVPGATYLKGLGRWVTRQELKRRWGLYQALRYSGPRSREREISDFDNFYAATIRVGARMSANGKQWQTSQPVEAILQGAMQTVWQRAVTGTHLHNHADDIFRMGAPYILPENTAASELYSNHLTHVLLDTFGLEEPFTVGALEHLRHWYLDEAHPFRYNSRIAQSVELNSIRLPHYPM